MPKAIKQEPDRDHREVVCTSVNVGPCGVSVAASRAGLYTEHDVKGELVLGPERLQPPNIAASLKRKSIRCCKGIAKPVSKPVEPLPCEICRRNKKHFRCEYCQMTFSTKLKIIKHLFDICYSWNTRILIKKSNKKQINKSKEKAFLCPKCNKSFNLVTTLQNHMSVHNPNRPYKCEHCSKRFKKKGALQVHERTHTGEKPYMCRFCVKSFTQQTSLNNHLLLHSGTKPHSCQICPKQFRQVSNLTQHLQKCHQKQVSTKNITNSSQPESKSKKSLKLVFF